MLARKKKSVSKRPTKSEGKKSEPKVKSHEAVRRELIISEEQKQEIEKEIPKMRVITPSSIAQKFGIRVSIAKAILNEQESKGVIKKVTSQGRFKLYTKTSA